MNCWPVGFVLFAGPDDESGLAAAKEYIHRNGWTNYHVKIVRTADGWLHVKTKFRFTYDLTPIM